MPDITCNHETIFIFLIILIRIINLNGQEHKIDSIQLEGYYMHGWENSAFYEIKNNKVYKPIWLLLADSCNSSDSLLTLIYLTEGNKGIYLYLKVIGNLKTGGNYGHLGAADSEIIVSKIIKVDTTKTMAKYFKDKRISP